MLAHYDDNDSGLMELDEFASLCYRLGYRPETRGHGHGRGHERGYGHERGGYERGRGGGHDRALEQLSEALSREEGRVELRKLFQQLDTDGDGRLSSEEWARGMGKQGTAMAKYFGGSTYEDLARAFSRIDANGDGCVTWDEMVEGAAHYKRTVGGSGYRGGRAYDEPRGGAPLPRVYTWHAWHVGGMWHGALARPRLPAPSPSPSPTPTRTEPHGHLTAGGRAAALHPP